MAEGMDGFRMNDEGPELRGEKSNRLRRRQRRLCLGWQKPEKPAKKTDGAAEPQALPRARCGDGWMDVWMDGWMDGWLA